MSDHTRRWRSAVESPVQDTAVDESADLLRDPYPLFAQKRRQSGVFRGSVMDWSKTPASMRPENLYAAVSFDAVNRVFRDGKVFNSHIYDSTIGLFIGPTILAMEGKKHREHRNLVSAAFKSKSLVQWEPTIVRPVVNALIDEFVSTQAEPTWPATSHSSFPPASSRSCWDCPRKTYRGSAVARSN